jgi:hypothetical protein
MQREAHAQAVVHAMTDRDFEDIVRGLIKVASGELKIEDVTLRTGIGGSDDDVPLRILSYIIPSLTIARRFKEKFNMSPRVELFTGQEGGIACNGKDAEGVRKNTDQAFHVIQKFVDTFFHDIKDQFSLVSDKEWTNPRVQLMIDYLENLLTNLMEKDEHLRKIGEELKGRGMKYGAETGLDHALRYAAFHIICFQDIPTVNRYIDPNAIPKTHIISIGGTAERDFDIVRDALTEHFSVEGFNQFALDSGQPDLKIQETLQPISMRSMLIADTGNIPPYFLAREADDITLPELHGLGVDELRGLFGERMRRALETFGACSGQEANRGAKDASSSFIKGMTMIAGVVSPDALIDFIHRFTHEESR